MDGLFFVQFHKYVGKKLGHNVWNSILKESGIGPETYVVSAEYPDQEAIDLISATSKLTGRSVSSILEDYGESTAPNLVEMYSAFFDPGWKTLDVLENWGAIVLKWICERNPETYLPDLKSTRLSPGEVVLTYDSPRKMCDVWKGIARGFAKHFNEEILVTENSCMLKGDPLCEISVALIT